MSVEAEANRLSFLTCSEDLFEGFIRERLNSTGDTPDGEIETENSTENHVSEVTAEEVPADSTAEVREKSIIDNTSNKEKPSDKKTIIVSRENLNLKNYFRDIIEKPITNRPKINIVNQLPIVDAPKPGHLSANNGFVKLSPIKINNGITKLNETNGRSGIFTLNSPVFEGGSAKTNEVFLNGKNVIMVQKKNLLVTNDCQSRKRPIDSISDGPEKETEETRNALVPIKKAKCIMVNKPLNSSTANINVLQGADRKSLNIPGISLLSDSFNGQVSQKVEVNIAGVSVDPKPNLDPEPRKSISKILEGGNTCSSDPKTTPRLLLTNSSGTQPSNFKKPIMINGQKTIVAKRPIAIDNAMQKRLLNIMKSSGQENARVQAPNSAITFKPISEHSVQCVVTKPPTNGLTKDQIGVDKVLNKPQTKRITIDPKTQRIIVHSDGQQPNKKVLNELFKGNLLNGKVVINQSPSVSSRDSQGSARPPSKRVNETSTNTSEMEIASLSVRNATLSSAVDKDLSEMYMDQLTNSALPNFEPPPPHPIGRNMLACAECQDKFTQQSSLDFHRERRSVLIGYWCCTCSRRLSFFNRCALLSHLRNHNQKLRSLDVSCVSIEPIPRNLIKFGNNYNNADLSAPSLTQQIIERVPVTTPEPDPVTTPVSLPDRNPPVTNSKSNTDRTPSNLVPTEALDVSGDPLQNNIEEEVNVNEEIGNVTTVTVPQEGVTDKIIEVETVAHAIHATPASINAKNNNGTPPKSALKPKIVVRRIRSCPECKLQLTGKISLQKHLLSENRPSDSNLRCNDCNLILPTRCSLRMHMRMHIPIKPYRCPECGIEYHIYERFMMHVRFECCHMAKVVKYFCTLCNLPQPTLSRLRVHVLDNHTRKIIKCNNCTAAYLNPKSIELHHLNEHSDIHPSATTYSQCRYCPGKLIPQKRFANHVAKHITCDKYKIYMYECYECKKCFRLKKDLIDHFKSCGVENNGNDTSVGTNGNVNANDAVSRPIILASGVNESNYVEVDDPAPVVNDGPEADDVIELRDEDEMLVPVRSTVDEVEVCEQDPLSLEGFRVEEQPVKEPKIEICVLCKKQQVIIQPGENPAQQSLCCRDCVQPCNENDLLQTRQTTITTRRKTRTHVIYRCKLCNYITIIDFNVQVNHFKRVHKNITESNIKRFVAIEKKNVYHSVRSKAVTAAESIKDKYLKKKKPSDAGVNSNTTKENHLEMDDYDDVIEMGKSPKKRSPSKPGTAGMSQFDRGLVMPSVSAVSNLKCSKCEFKAQQLTELREHVTLHRTDPNALQCLECGECFVVLPSLEKHLTIHHGIGDVHKYMTDNPTCVPPPDNSCDSLKCSVCFAMFESRLALDKHIRTHGMAFLQQAKPIS